MKLLRCPIRFRIFNEFLGGRIRSLRFELNFQMELCFSAPPVTARARARRTAYGSARGPGRGGPMLRWDRRGARAAGLPSVHAALRPAPASAGRFWNADSMRECPGMATSILNVKAWEFVKFPRRVHPYTPDSERQNVTLQPPEFFTGRESSASYAFRLRKA